MRADIGVAINVVNQFWATRWPQFFTGRYSPPHIFGGFSRTGRPAPYCGNHRLAYGNAYYCPNGDFIAWDDDLIRTAATVAAPASASSQAGSAGRAGSGGRAVNLELSAKTRHKLADAYWLKHRSAARGKVDGPSRVYYGKITGATTTGNVYWALGNIGVKGDPISYQDGPHIWRKRGGGTWQYLGDTGGCPDRVPRALLKVWHYSICG
jgi:hypothetical protein